MIGNELSLNLSLNDETGPIVKQLTPELLNINISLSSQYQLFCLSSYQYQYQLFSRGLININTLSIIQKVPFNQFQYQYILSISPYNIVKITNFLSISHCYQYQC